MNSHFPSLPPFMFCTILFILIFAQIPFVFGNNTAWHTSCSNQFSCGGISRVDYPFWGGLRPQECGHPGLQLTCENNTPTIEIMAVKYRVLKINPTFEILRISRQDVGANDICPDKFVNTTLDSNLFEYTSGYVNLTVQYGCPPFNIQIPSLLTCTINGTTYQNGYVVPGAQGPGLCRASVFFPIHSTTFGGLEELANLGESLNRGFEVWWKVDSTKCNECKSSSGTCGYDLKSDQFTCLCPSDESFDANVCRSASSREDHSAQLTELDSVMDKQEPFWAKFNVVFSSLLMLSISFLLLCSF